MWFLAAAMWEWICLESSLSWSSCLLSRPNCSREALSIPPRLALLPSICFRLSVRKFCKQKYYFLFEKMKLETRETRVPQFCNCYWQFTSRQKWSRFCHIFLEQSLVWKYCLKLEGCLHNLFLIGPHSAAAEPNSAPKIVWQNRRRFCRDVRILRMRLNPRKHRCRYSRHSWSLVHNFSPLHHRHPNFMSAYYV